MTGSPSIPNIGIDARKVQDFGIGTYVRGLVRALAVIDHTTRYRLLVAPAGREVLAGLPPNFELVTERARPYSLREQLGMPWTLRRLRLDLFHSTHYVLPAYVPSRVVVTIHDIIHLLFPELLPNRFAFQYARGMFRRSLTRGDRILAVSARTRSDLVEILGVDAERIEVIYNGVDEVFRTPIPAAERVDRLARLGLTEPYVLFVGNPKPHKNLDRLVQAWARATAQVAFAGPLVVVGDRGAESFKVRQRAEQLGLGHRIRFLGFVPDEDLPLLYQGATLFLYPTLYEGFGLPVVEAMASGTPVLTSNTSALEEIARDYAELVDPLDVDALAAAITRVLGDGGLRQRLGERGRHRAEAFSWARAAARTRQVYLEVLGVAPAEASP